MIKLPPDIKLIISDFDGVFTDGGIYISDDMSSTKKINYKDIMALSLALKSGYKIAIVSGEKSSIIDYLCDKFNAIEQYQGIRIKKEVVANLLKKHNLKPNEALYIGDDVNDIDAMGLVGCAITVPNAVFKVKQLAYVQITQSQGGDGAFREVVDALLG